MSGDIITYSKLREYQRDERREPTLVKLPENIVELIKIYLNEKQNVLKKNKDESNLFSQDMYSRIEYELKNAVRCIANIFEIRQKKIVDKAFQTSKNDVKVKDTTNMLSFEKKLFKKLINLFNDYNEKCILAILKKEEPGIKEKTFKREETSSIKDSDKLLIRITEEVPSFQWKNGVKMGPFKKEDVVNVPKKLGSLLIKQEKGKEVKRG